jgi:3-phenylpropionate/trans-cinnamate dioxygenase ferredoxin reductase subunit
MAGLESIDAPGDHAGHVVIVGAGLGGLRTAESLRRIGHTGPITLIGAEKHHPYDRPPLSKDVLRGDRPVVPLRQLGSYAELDLDLRLGVTAVSVNTEGKSVALDDGSDVGYDALVVATGAVPRQLPIFSQASNVHVLRTLDDADRLRGELVEGNRLAVIGAGFIGCEAAASARAMGVEVVLIELLPAPLSRVLGTQVGEQIAALHASHGVDVRTATSVTEAKGTSRIERLVLSDGSEVAVDVVLVGLGVTPSTEWLVGSGIELGNGVHCDSGGRTSAAGVYAVGDLACWEHPISGAKTRTEHWTSAVEQAEVVAHNIISDSSGPSSAEGRDHAAVPYVWSDQYDLKIQVVGYPSPDDDVQLLTVGKFNRTLALYSREGKFTAAVGMSTAAAVMKLRALLQGAQDGSATLEDAIALVTPAPPAS